MLTCSRRSAISRRPLPYRRAALATALNHCSAAPVTASATTRASRAASEAPVERAGLPRGCDGRQPSKRPGSDRGGGSANPCGALVAAFPKDKMPDQKVKPRTGANGGAALPPRWMRFPKGKKIALLQSNSRRRRVGSSFSPRAAAAIHHSPHMPSIAARPKGI